MSLLVVPVGLLLFGVVGGLAAYCSRRRTYRVFVLGLLLLAATWMVVQVSLHMVYIPLLRAISISAVEVAPLVIVYLIVPGLIVRRRGANSRVLISAFLATAVAFPLWCLYDFVAFCYFVPDCLG